MINETPTYIKLYLTNTIVNSDVNSEVAVTSLTALTDIQTYDLYCYTYVPMPVKEGSNLGGEGYTLLENLIYNYEYEIKTRFFVVPTEFSDYMALADLFKNYKHKYFAVVDNTFLGSAIHTTNKAIAVTTTEFSSSLESGLLQYTIKFQKRK